ncbi:hypothetical protein UlMin_008405 [Ulmus minor]
MDLWIVAAATCAGYLAKYWQSISRDWDGSLRLSSGDSEFKKSESPSCPLRSLSKRRKQGDDISTDRRVFDSGKLDGTSGEEVASTSGENMGSFENFKELDVLSISNLQLGFLGNENLKEHEGGRRFTGVVNDGSCDFLPIPATGEMDSANGSTRNKSSLKTERSRTHFLKPKSSLESCLVAQLSKERADMEEYVLSSLPSPSTPSMRTLIVTDGSRRFNTAYSDSFSAQIGIEGTKLHKEVYLEEDEKKYGVPPLPKIGSLDPAKKMKAKTGKGRNGKVSSSRRMINGNEFDSQGGSLDESVLFCLGISIGIISSIIANKSEVDKLKDLLKQTENLVQDLQEELEMKDSLTVKELANENYGSQDTSENFIYEKTPKAFTYEQNIDSSARYDDGDSYNQKVDETSESLSKIEAELEAELERLGLSVNAPTLARRWSGIVEVDPDFDPVFVQGELRADTLREQDASGHKSKDGNSTSTPHHYGNYAVCPRELSLRLHEVIQSRLEERVNYLEVALQNSERKVKIMESEHKNRAEMPSYQLRYFSNEESPIAKEESNSTTQPLVMNLSGEALDAYNEAYEELMKISDSEEEDLPHRLCEIDNTLFSDSFSHQMLQSQNNDGIIDLVPNSAIAKEKSVVGFLSDKLRLQEEHSFSVQRSNDTSDSQEGTSGSDDEMEKQLIKQIVERTKKGSPVVLNAQKLLFSLEENEQ